VLCVGPRVLCVVAALPEDVRLETLRSIFYQTVPVVGVLISIEHLEGGILFPAKMAKILNNALSLVNLDNIDYILRVDSDVILPFDFIEANVKGGYAIMGEGYAQLINARVLQKYFGGRLHEDHDDGYLLVKGRQLGLKITHTGYIVPPIKRRVNGVHQGSKWFFAQGDLKYRYGYEPIAFGANLIFGESRCVYTVFEVFGWVMAMVRRKSRFDVAAQILYRQLDKYRRPAKLFKIGAYGASMIRGLLK
jgi:hypothetical protein